MLKKEVYEAVCRNLKAECLSLGVNIKGELLSITIDDDLEKFPGNLIYDAIKKLAHEGYLEMMNDDQVFKINDYGYNFFTNFN